MNLFKLKKGGKHVGYLNLDKGVHWSDEDSIPSEPIGFDEALPYVCDDKNGEKVFADDKVDIFMNGESQGRGTAILIPRIAQPLSSHTEYYNPHSWDIELIKEDNNG